MVGTLANVPSGAVKILAGDRRRRGLQISCTTGGPIGLGNNGNIAVTTSIQLNAGNTPLQFWYEDMGAGICAEWWVVATAVGSEVSWSELQAPSQID